MRRLAMREATLEYAECYFLFPLSVSIMLLTSAWFFGAMQGLIHVGIETLGRVRMPLNRGKARRALMRWHMMNAIRALHSRASHVAVHAR